MRAILDDEHAELTREDVEIVLEMREALTERLERRLKRPSAQKNPDLALWLEILNQWS